jgi:hypothetical protein
MGPRGACAAARSETQRSWGSRLRWLKLLIQRLLVLALGVVTVWLIAFVIFDVADRRLPLVLAVGLTYGLAAYVVLPRAIRMGRHILRRERVPSYTITGDGLPGDPVNLALIGTVCQLRRAFAVSGWSEADALSLASSWRMVRAFVLNQPYPKAPFSTLYLFGRGHDVGFQQPIGDSPRKRNHVRFWGLPLERAARTIDTPSFWLESPQPTSDERALWVGAATKDIGFSLTRLSFQITHATDADTDEERNFLICELQRHSVIVNIRSRLPGERLSIGKINRYVTDGAVAVAELE